MGNRTRKVRSLTDNEWKRLDTQITLLVSEVEVLCKNFEHCGVCPKGLCAICNAIVGLDEARRQL